eukprot:TRINITY_DN10762_c0_g1_i1.p1 TRINITY_DN10762_c0_g1~~TRINITY_DN10762_c0_g1_i1.p1  ORF type:complete len:568 (+),score=136.99 TRINITY_DN10762_c0_g1_i1:188-1891(+)
MEFLELQGLDFNQQYMSLLVTLKQEMVAKIPTMAVDVMTKLLEQTFPYVLMDEIQEIPITILKNLPEIPRPYAQFIASHQRLYEVCPVEVKRSVWLLDEKLFSSEVYPLIQSYLSEATQTFTENYMLHNATMRPQARREKIPILKELAKRIGSRITIYQMFVNYLKTLYSTNPAQGICSLRKDVLMTFHDLGFVDVCNQDRTFLLAWRLDACSVDNLIDERRIKELNSYFDSLGSNSALEPKLWGDIAMILNHPSVMHLLQLSIYSTLLATVEKRILPRADDNLQFLTILAGIGLNSHSIVVSGTYTPSRVDKGLLSIFYPYLASVILDRMMNNELSADPVFEQFKSYLSGNKLARKELLYFVVSRFVEKDYPFVEYFLPTILEWGLQMDAETYFTYTVVQIILQEKDFTPKLRKSVIVDFLIPLCGISEKHVSNLAQLFQGLQSRIHLKELRKMLTKCQELGIHNHDDFAAIFHSMQTKFPSRTKHNPETSDQASNLQNVDSKMSEKDTNMTDNRDSGAVHPESMDHSSDPSAEHSADGGQSSDGSYSGSSSYRYDDDMREGESFM